MTAGTGTAGAGTDWSGRLRSSSLATIVALAPHYLAHGWLHTPLLTDAIAEWIMARTPNRYALAIMDSLGSWAKPAAATGGLAALGFAMLAARLFGWWLLPLFATLYGWLFETSGWSFWIPALLATIWLARRDRKTAAATFDPSRRNAIVQIASPVVMLAGTAAVAVESRVREGRLAQSAVTPVDLFPSPPLTSRENFAPGLVRAAVTPTAEFYGMSKNTVDPALDPRSWRLQVTLDGKPLREFSYSQLMNLRRTERYISLRCISNTLKSNLMGCAHWSGIPLRSLLAPDQIPGGIREVAILGADGHGDSLSLDYAFSDGPMFALGMNGKTLDRTHGFPIRLLAPRYYGLKSVKWISELRLVTEPFYGTWPKLGYTKEPRVHPVCYIDKMRKSAGFVEAGGIAMAGDRGIRQVLVRLDGNEWTPATLEPPLSAETWVRWKAQVPYVAGAGQIEARAQDGEGVWQAVSESPLFPDGVKGPTVRRLSI